jgi:hypothetical protein
MFIALPTDHVLDLSQRENRGNFEEMLGMSSLGLQKHF